MTPVKWLYLRTNKWQARSQLSSVLLLLPCAASSIPRVAMNLTFSENWVIFPYLTCKLFLIGKPKKNKKQKLIYIISEVQFLLLCGLSLKDFPSQFLLKYPVNHTGWGHLRLFILPPCSCQIFAPFIFALNSISGCTTHVFWWHTFL